MPANDNVIGGRDSLLLAHDAQGQAALVLVESLIHGMIERSMLSIRDAVEIIEAAKDVQADVAEAADGAGAGARMWRSHVLLVAMSASLKTDLPDVDGQGSSPEPLP